MTSQAGSLSPFQGFYDKRLRPYFGHFTYLAVTSSLQVAIQRE
jgi:hypothetical protein